MELEEAKKLLKEMQENCKNKTIYKDEKAEAKAEAIEVVLKEVKELKKENEELKLKDYYLPAWVTKKYVSKDKIRKLEDMWNDNIWNATDEASEEKAEMIRDVYRGLLDE